MLLRKSQYEEIKDRISVFAGMCDTYLQQHPVSKINPNVKSAVEDAVNAILKISEEVDVSYSRAKEK